MVRFRCSLKEKCIQVENEKSGAERRRFNRLDSTVPLQYKNLRAASPSAAGSLTKNLSEGGVCFETSQFISLACRLVLEINLPSRPKPIKAISKVAWIRRIPSSDQYELGNQFLDMSKEDKAVVTNFINETLASNL